MPPSTIEARSPSPYASSVTSSRATVVTGPPVSTIRSPSRTPAASSSESKRASPGSSTLRLSRGPAYAPQGTKRAPGTCPAS